ncbi:hypothetical protein SAMN05518872_11230 [Psychrobacillus sp. OK032]|nr:hypothetical protein SAMN05518872_11230 [Psychrobacillus sp. OK032]
MLVTKALPHDVAHLAFVPLVRQMSYQNVRAAVMAHRSPRGKRPLEAEILADTTIERKYSMP